MISWSCEVKIPLVTTKSVFRLKAISWPRRMRIPSLHTQRSKEPSELFCKVANFPIWEMSVVFYSLVLFIIEVQEGGFIYLVIESHHEAFSSVYQTKYLAVFISLAEHLHLICLRVKVLKLHTVISRVECSIGSGGNHPRHWFNVAWMETPCIDDFILFERKGLHLALFVTIDTDTVVSVFH